MATSDFLAFATVGSPNVISQATYLAASFRTAGFSAGVAESDELNKVWRQSAFVAAALAEFMLEQTGLDVLDDADLAGFVVKLKAAVGGSAKPARIVTASTTLALLASDYAVGLARTVAPAAMVANLPDLSASAQYLGKEIVVEDLADNFFSFPVTVTPPGGQTIAGLATFVMNIDRQSSTFRWYGSNLWGLRK